MSTAWATDDTLGAVGTIDYHVGYPGWSSKGQISVNIGADIDCDDKGGLTTHEVYASRNAGKDDVDLKLETLDSLPPWQNGQKTSVSEVSIVVSIAGTYASQSPAKASLEKGPLKIEWEFGKGTWHKDHSFSYKWESVKIDKEDLAPLKPKQSRKTNTR